MHDKTVLITGSTSGIGLAAALELLGMGANVIVHGRSQARCENALEELRRRGAAGRRIDYVAADLSSQGNVRELARSVVEKYGRLDVLINNAGAVFMTRKLSADGIEMTFATNHLAYFLLTTLLLPLLRAAPSAQIINVSSGAHFGNPLDFENLEFLRGYLPLKAYGCSKFANILFTYALAVAKVRASAGDGGRGTRGDEGGWKDAPRAVQHIARKLLEEIKRSGREIKKGKRLMIVGNDVHNSNWMAALEELDAVVVTEEMITVGTRYFWGKVDTSLPPMEGIARHYLFNRPQDATIYLSNRYDHIFKLAKEYRVDGVISDVVRYCAPLENDKPWLKKEMDQHGIPLLELGID